LTCVNTRKILLKSHTKAIIAILSSPKTSRLSLNFQVSPPDNSIYINTDIAALSFRVVASVGPENAVFKLSYVKLGLAGFFEWVEADFSCFCWQYDISEAREGYFHAGGPPLTGRPTGRR
jgi:hypothetical protein